MRYSDLVSITKGKFNHHSIPDSPIGVISTDSRTIQAGEIFVALVGENFDGHQFVATAFAKGATLAIVNYNLPEYPCLVVENTLTAYQQIAQAWRQQAHIPLIAITGSAGKTTTKEMISSLLEFYCSPQKTVHRSQANFNNDIGVAKTLLEINPDRHDFVVVEMGMRGRGEIDRLSAIAMPNVAVITNIGTAHIGRLGSREAIAEAKCEILHHLSGVAVLNGEDELLLQTAAHNWRGKTITYGIDRGEVRGEIVNDRLVVNNCTWQLPLPGRHNTLNFLAGISVLTALELDLSLSTTKPIELDLPQGRTNLIHLANGAKLLDETYNASPEAVIASLSLLKSFPGRHWAVLGTMKELGEHSQKLHREVGETIDRLGIYGLIVLEDADTQEIVKAARSVSKKYTCKTQDEILQILLTEIKSDDVILCKASRSIGLEQLVHQLQLLP
ncbi:MAG: UDP-N-acetylmuramoyl-tripeptide--D-alanyl-D-alanine ligase [Cyanobacteria bacterium M5B4]|nr:MAG: UDP-N-acetylmuramoyl-tripeptide--D-alanyl-D-alanine ligase [Cyanobacteria bacterium M5B4]